MAKADYDAVVIGAGPAGSLAARGLARAGRRVLLVDKHSFPRPKVCGCCLNHYALSGLERAGLGELVGDLGAPALHHLNMVAAGREAVVELPPSVSLSREVMDQALVEAAQTAGADVRQGVSAKVTLDVEHSDGLRQVRMTNGQMVRAHVIVVADGLGGTSLKEVEGFGVETRAASRIGFGGVADRASVSRRSRVGDGVIFMACGRHGYLGAVRLEDGRIDLAAAVDAAAVKSAGGWAAVARQILEESGLPADALPIDGVERWRATPALTRHRKKLAGPGIFVVGDAAGYVEPFTGEGMAWAIAGGNAVVPLASQAIEGWDVAQETAWHDVYSKQIRRRQTSCRMVAATLRRPWLTRATVRVLAAAPGLVSPVLRRMTRPGRKAAAYRPHQPSARWHTATGNAG